MVKKIFRVMGDILITIIVCFALTSILSMARSGSKKGYIPGIGGYKFMAVLSDSMNPTFRIYDMIIAKEVSPEEIKEGDVITFSLDNVLVTHRIQKIEKKDGHKLFITRGDANNTEDSTPVMLNDIKAKYIGRIPYMGLVISKIRSPLGVGILWCVLSFIIIFEIFTAIENKKKLDKSATEDTNAKI